MPHYRYRAVDKQGHQARGSLDAANDVDLELRLRRMGLDLITHRVVNERGGAGSRGRITRHDLIAFCFHMEAITRSGIPLIDGLVDLRDSLNNPRFRDVLAVVVEDMEGGKLLSETMRAHPTVFDDVFTNLIRAGEQTGDLTAVFENLGRALKWQDEILARTKRLMIYPTLVLVVVGGVVGFLLLVLVPQIVGVIKQLGVALPPETRALLLVSETLSRYGVVLLGIPVVAAIAGLVAVRSSSRARYLADYLKLRLPFFGPVLQKIIIARLATFIALMYRSGITILDALATAEGIAANRVIRDGLRRASARISAGDGLTESFKNTGLFPPLVIRMLRVGEATGALDAALANVSYFYDREVTDSIDTGLKLLEPVLTLILGLVTGVIVLSVLVPVYDVIGRLRI